MAWIPGSWVGTLADPARLSMTRLEIARYGLVCRSCDHRFMRFSSTDACPICSSASRVHEIRLGWLTDEDATDEQPALT